MNSRYIVSILFGFLCLSLFSQPRIIRVNYISETEAELFRNNPPSGVTYYWQGTSCGTSTADNSIRYTANTTNTYYYLRAYSNSISSWLSPCASTSIVMPDLTPPVFVDVLTGPMEPGTMIEATCNESANVYLVHESVGGTWPEINSAQLAHVSVLPYVPFTISTAGFDFGEYVLYAIDVSGNISFPSPIITLTDLTEPVLSGVTTGIIDLGTNVSATSNEGGIIYLVPDGTPKILASILSSRVSEEGVTGGNPGILSTTGVDAGNYIVYAVDAYENISDPAGVITLADLTAPTLSDVTSGTINSGTDISATSNEDGRIYLVPNGTAPNIGVINSVKVGEEAVTAGVPSILGTSGIPLGEYIVYAIDGADNVSAPSGVIRVADLEIPVLYDVTSGAIEEGTNISATCNEDAEIYLVPDGTAGIPAAIISAQLTSNTATANDPTTLSTIGIALGNYIVFAIDAFNNVSSPSALITIADLTAPILSDVTSGTISEGTNIYATSNENSIIYLVLIGTPANAPAIIDAHVSSSGATAGNPATISTAGVPLDDYIVFAIDESENVSDASGIITIADLIAPLLSDVSTGSIDQGTDISATSNEDGFIYLVPNGTSATLAAVTGSEVANSVAEAGIPVALATTSIDLGEYQVYAIDVAENVSNASAVINLIEPVVPDNTPPVLSNVTSGSVEQGTSVFATSNEAGNIFLTPEGTAADLTAINNSKVAEAVAMKDAPVTLSTAGIDIGNYIVFAVDAADNISTPSAVIEIVEASSPDITPPVLSDVTSGNLEQGTDVSATSNEVGVIYLVPEGTAATTGAIGGAKVAEVIATAGVPVFISTDVISPGNYIVYAIDASDNVSSPSSLVIIIEASGPDITPPILTAVSEGPVVIGENLLATSNEDGVVYLVPDGTASDIGVITAEKVVEEVAIAGSPVMLLTTGLSVGDYQVYALDASNNISNPSSAISLTNQISGLINQSEIDLLIYPRVVNDFISIISQDLIEEIVVYSIQGSRVMHINQPSEMIDMYHLNPGVYILRVRFDDNKIQTVKIIKN